MAASVPPCRGDGAAGRREDLLGGNGAAPRRAGRGHVEWRLRGGLDGGCRRGGVGEGRGNKRVRRDCAQARGVEGLGADEGDIGARGD